MEEMKNFIRRLLPFLLLIFFTSCATTSGVHKEKHQNGKKLLFEDWKYRGFGYELPVWFEAAYKDKPQQLQELVPELKDREIIILRGQGLNSDQAEQNLKLQLSEADEDFVIYDSSWAMLESEKYISIAILYKEKL